ncbi:hypothetical protein ACEWY4_022373 [Coilia grayii]|uniref:Uncharacterized protein n=1 Tax=Coilia grayii TaxID=363190 RepID=A0ABD1J7M7_9TELE
MAARQGSQEPQIFKVTLVLVLALLVREVDGNCAKKKNGNSSNSPMIMKILTLSSTHLQSLPQPNHQTLAIRNRSLSPWQNIISEDSSRLPKKLSEAQCLKRGCVGHNGEEDMGLKSAPIQLEVLVLKRVRGKKRAREYQLSSQVITVGCTCIRERVVRYD